MLYYVIGRMISLKLWIGHLSDFYNFIMINSMLFVMGVPYVIVTSLIWRKPVLQFTDEER